MAIDTRDKRASALGESLPFLLQLPLADGTIGTSDRAQQAYTYSGIAIAAPPADPKNEDLKTVLGPHGYPMPPYLDLFTTKDPGSIDRNCTYLSLICTRAAVLDTPITLGVDLSTGIETTYVYEAKICVRNELNTPIDDSATELSTGIGC